MTLMANNPFDHIDHPLPTVVNGPFNRVPVFSTMGRGPRGEKGDVGFIEFADPIEWDSSRTYESGVIVLSSDGVSYLSKQKVPVDIPLTDERYWGVTATPSAQVERYRQEVQSFEDDILEKAFAFDTVADMQASENLYDGAICHTNGFHESGDGGSAWYIITSEGEANGMDVIACGTLFANYIQVSEAVNVRQFGAYGDNTHDDTSPIQHALDNYVNVFIPKATPIFKVTQLTLHSRNHLLGCGQDSLIQSSLTNGDFIIVTDANAERPIVEKIRIIGNYNMSGIRFVSTNLDIQTASKVIDCNIEKVIDGIKFDQYQTECVVDRTIITGASHDGIIAPTSDCKFCNTTVGRAGHVGFNFRDSTQIHISDCKAYECGGNTTEDTYGLGSDGYGVCINTYSIITNLALEGMFHNGLLMRYGNIVAGLEINSINYVTHEGETTDIDSYGVVFENSGNIVQGVMIDGIYSYGDYIIGETQQTENNVIDLALVKRTNQHSSGSTHIVTNNPNQNFANNTVKINGKSVYGEFLTANRLYGGVELPSTANLNDYTKYGNYYYSSSNVSQMTNCPATSGFVMKVESALGPGSGSYQYIRQTLQQYNAPFTTFTRVYTMSAQTFSQWYKVTPETV